MLFMLFIRLGVDKNIIKINNHELVEVLHEDRIHEPREGSRSICEAKRHDCILVFAIASNESSLGNVLFADFDLVISTSQVQLGEYHSTRKLIKEVIYARKRISVLYGLLIQRPVINYQAISLILLLDKDSGASPWR